MEEIEKLINIAGELAGKFDLNTNYRNTAGSVASALCTSEKKIFTGINLDLKCGMGICAEQAAIMEMLKQHETRIDTIVCVHHSGKIYLPCGRCREFILQINSDNKNTKIITPNKEVTTLDRLLKY